MDAKQETITSLKKGTWSPQEDSLLINYIDVHGEGRWNYVARGSGLNRTGKSCRLRWKNYLQPNVRRGNFTAEEELRMAELHCIYGNRWSRIAEFLPGRTDNEIKNYWRSRVHKQAKQLKYDTKSEELREFVRNIWLPRLSLQIHANSQCNNFIYSDIDRVTMMNSHEKLQLQIEGAHQDNMSNNNIDCGFYSPMTMASQMELGQHSYNEDLPSPACFCYGELSNMMLTDDWYI